MAGIHASYALACTNCIMELLTKASVLVLRVLLHVNLPVLVWQTRHCVELRRVRGGTVISGGDGAVAPPLSFPLCVRDL